MNMILLTGPSLEPVTLAEMKLWLKIDGSADDTVINALIVSARLSVEAVTKRILITQSWRVVLDEWRQGGLIRLPTGPLQSVTAARVAHSCAPDTRAVHVQDTRAATRRYCAASHPRRAK